jgi:hypothetical protein
MKRVIFFICCGISLLWSEPTVVGVFGGAACPWSEQLRTEVWESSTFQSLVEKSGIRRQTREATPNDSETPVFILLSSQGKEIGRLGYLIVPPEKYAQLFNEMLVIEALSYRLDNLTSDQLLSLYRKCQVLNMAACEEKILKAGLAIDKGTDFLLEYYAKLCKDHPNKARKIKEEIRTRRPSSSAVEWQLALLSFQTKHETGKEVKDVVKSLEKYLKRYADQDVDTRWRCHLILAEFYKEKNQMDKAKSHAAQAIADAPAELQQMIVPLGTYD